MFVLCLRFGHLLSQEWNIHLTLKITLNPSRLWLTFPHAYNLSMWNTIPTGLFWLFSQFLIVSSVEGFHVVCWFFKIEIITMDFSMISSTLLCRLSHQRLEPSKTIFWLCDVMDYLFTWVVALSLCFQFYESLDICRQGNKMRSKACSKKKASQEYGHVVYEKNLFSTYINFWLKLTI